MSKENHSKEHIEFLRNIKRKKKLIFFTQISILIIFFITWELLARFKVIDTFLTSYPSQMWELFLRLSADGSLFKHIGISVFETVIGFILGTVFGTLIAILLWWSEFIAKVLDPYMVILNALPKTALAPIIIVWAGAGISGIIVTALMVASVTHFSRQRQLLELLWTFKPYISINEVFLFRPYARHSSFSNS